MANESKIEIAENNAQSRSEIIRDAIVREQARDIEAERKSAFWTKWAALETQMKNKSHVDGVVISVINSKESANVYFQVLVADSLACLIPFYEFYRKNPLEKADESERKKREYQMARKVIGAHIQFLILAMKIDNEDAIDDYTIVGSRARWLAIQEENFFKPGKNGVAKVKEGDFVDAYITSVGMNSLNACICGVDTTIEKWSLTFRHVPDLREARDYRGNRLYAPGMTLTVQIRQIMRSEDDRIKLIASAKSYELIQASKNSLPIRRGMTCFGQVSSIHVHENTGEINIWLWLQGFERPASAKFVSGRGLYQQVNHGSTCELTVIGVTESGMVKCRVLSTNSPFNPHVTPKRGK